MVLELKDREIILRIGTGFSSGIRAVSYTTTRRVIHSAVYLSDAPWGCVVYDMHSCTRDPI